MLDLFKPELVNYFGLKSQDPFWNPRFSWESGLKQNKKEDTLEVYMEVPGVEKENLNITVDNRIVTISGFYELGGEKINVKKAITVSKLYDLENIKAKLHNGILTLVFAKQEKEKKKNIKILVE